MKPKIGISLRITNAENYTEKRDSLSHDWPILLEKIGFSPVLIPNTLLNITSFLDEMNLSGLILSGGDNIGDDKERDTTEKQILDYGISNNLPIMGICRGMQVINSYFGGKIQSLENSSHVNNPHMIKVTKYLSIKDNLIQVNSFHNNIITSNDLGKNLSPFAISQSDNTIEGIVHDKLSILGVMWHPERKPDSNSISLIKKIFRQNN
tara:strand:- start:20 stop:643 length:624 start_codon:yes stop_codon:yes gene_type:complete